MNQSELSGFLARLATIAAFALGLYAMYIARDIVVSAILAGVFATIISPLLSRAEERGIPTAVALVGIYLAMFGLAFLLLFAVVPLVTKEFVGFAGMLKDWAKTATEMYESGNAELIPGLSFLNAQWIDPGSMIDMARSHAKDALSWLSDNFSTIAGRFGTWILGVFGTLTTIGFTFVLGFFLALERKSVYRFVLSMLPAGVSTRIQQSAPMVDKVFLVWLRGQAILCFTIFLMTLIGLYVLDWGFGIPVRNHFQLAIIAGLCEFIPVIGPLLAAIPAIIIGISGGPVAVAALAGLYLLIQEIENWFLVPYVQGGALELSTFTVLLAMAVTGSLFGVVGVLLVLPVLAALKVMLYPQEPEIRKAAEKAKKTKR